jgi:anthranilate phosphoribosyltransferase
MLPSPALIDRTFLRRFIRDPEAITPGEYASFLGEVFVNAECRGELIAWFAAASARPFSTYVAVRLAEAVAGTQSRIVLPEAESAVNIVGTGGGRQTFNISTAAAFVAAAAGARVLKSGSPAYNSRSGAIDVLRSLGVLFDAKPEQLAECLTRYNLAFVPPAAYPPVLRRIAVTLMPLTLRDVGGIVNMVGPLLCPYKVGAQLIGVAQAPMLRPYAEALRQHGSSRAWIVHAEIGLDELCSLSRNHVVAIGDAPERAVIDPIELGCQSRNLEALNGGTAQESARLVEALLAGHGDVEQQETVALNAAAALVLAGSEPDYAAAYRRCANALQRGDAFSTLVTLRQYAQCQLSGGVRSAQVVS